MTLAYCTNVAPAPSPAALVADLRGLWRDVREQSGLEVLGLGLWFPRDLARELVADSAALDDVRRALDESGLRAVTYNAFPADAFHAPVVKDAVYRPDWRDPARRAYTLDVAAIATELAAEGAVVPVSTLPLGFPRWETADRRAAARQLIETARELLRMAATSGVRVHLALEPEPCCALERSDDLLAFWREDLLPAARGEEVLIGMHLGACLDLCHAAVAHEDAVEVLGRYARAGIAVPKVQVSAALHVPDPTDAEQRRRLAPFVEERWLHQVGAGDGRIVTDLPVALADEAHAAAAPWRVHYHVPLHRAEVGGLPTTRDEVRHFLRHMATLRTRPLLELETYTWSVVPGATQDLAANVAAEIRWAVAALGEPRA